jgi:hypothetical protein
MGDLKLPRAELPLTITVTGIASLTKKYWDTRLDSDSTAESDWVTAMAEFLPEKMTIEDWVRLRALLKEAQVSDGWLQYLFQYLVQNNRLLG